jgi:hypothetical protein
MGINPLKKGGKNKIGKVVLMGSLWKFIHRR